MFNFFKKLEILYEAVLHLFFINFRNIRLIMSRNATTNDFVYDWSHGGHLAKSVSFFVIGVVIITLNVAEIIIITRKKNRRKHEYLLIGMSSSDTLLGSSFLIYRVIDVYASIPVTPIFIIFFFCLTASVLHILIISIERLVAVLYPIQHKVFFTMKKLKMLISVVWICTLAITTAVAVSVDKTKCTNDGHVLSEALAVAIMIFTVDVLYISIYCVILKKLWTSHQSSTGNSMANIIQKRERKAMIMCVTITCVFVLFTAPTATAMALYQRTPIWSRIPLLLNSISNSVVYFFLGKFECKLCWRTMDVNSSEQHNEI